MGRGCIVKVWKWLSRMTHESPRDCKEGEESLTILAFILLGSQSETFFFFSHKTPSFIPNAA